MSWVFMFGDRDNPDREYMCQSDPLDPCAVPANRPGDPVFADVHFYYHGTGAETRYAGTINISFMAGSAKANPNVTVVKLKEIVRASVTGVVTAMPGTYQVSFDLTATPKNGTAIPIRFDVPVVVK